MRGEKTQHGTGTGLAIMAASAVACVAIIGASAVVMLLSAAPSVVGAVGAYVGSEALALGSMAGGVFSLPAYILLAFALRGEAGAAEADQ